MCNRIFVKIFSHLLSLLEILRIKFPIKSEQLKRLNEDKDFSHLKAKKLIVPERIGNISPKEIAKEATFLINNSSNLKKLKYVIKKFNPNIIIHFAAESHVDNSIKSPGQFINSNILLL